MQKKKSSLVKHNEQIDMTEVHSYCEEQNEHPSIQWYGMTDESIDI